MDNTSESVFEIVQSYMRVGSRVSSCSELSTLQNELQVPDVLIDPHNLVHRRHMSHAMLAWHGISIALPIGKYVTCTLRVS